MAHTRKHAMCSSWSMWICHVTQMNEWCPTDECVMSHTKTQRTHKSMLPPHGCGLLKRPSCSHISMWMCHVPQMDVSCPTRRLCANIRACCLHTAVKSLNHICSCISMWMCHTTHLNEMNHVPQMNESCSTYECNKWVVEAPCVYCVIFLFCGIICRFRIINGRFFVRFDLKGVTVRDCPGSRGYKQGSRGYKQLSRVLGHKWRKKERHRESTTIKVYQWVPGRVRVICGCQCDDAGNTVKRRMRWLMFSCVYIHMCIHVNVNICIIEYNLCVSSTYNPCGVE